MSDIEALPILEATSKWLSNLMLVRKALVRKLVDSGLILLSFTKI
jgi:hypothetical protein